MLVHTTIVVFLVYAALSANAGVLKGVVKENELAGSTMANVAISAPGANPTMSGQYGEFTLNFPHKKPGETVLLSITKSDFVVVNDIQLEQVLPADPDAKLLVILICPPGRREEMARRFYRLVGGKAIEAYYRKRLKELQAANTEQIALLQKERDQAKANADKMSEQLALAKPGQMSEIFNQALRLFVDGRTEEALRVLNEGQLQQSLVAARKRKEEAEKAIEQAALSWVLKARLLSLQFKFEDADNAYEEARQAAPDNFEVNSDFAYFNQYLHRYTTARKGYERCLALARQRGDDSKIADTLNNLGALHFNQNRMNEAHLAYNGALKIYRELAKKKPDIYLPRVAMTLNNLGNLDSDQSRMPQACLAYVEALRIQRELALKDPDTYMPNVAITLNDLGAFYGLQNRPDRARRALDEALKIQRELALKDPDTYLPEVAMTLNNLGIMEGTQGRIQEARLAFDEALKIRRELAHKNPDTYLPEVALTLNNLGSLDSGQNRMDGARLAYDEALKIYRELAKENLDAYLPKMAMTLINLGTLNRAQNRMQEARSAYEEALGIYQGLAARDPDQSGRYIKGTKALIDQLPTTH
jgi:tetratricopeptide (TPR) repeat protein